MKCLHFGLVAFLITCVGASAANEPLLPIQGVLDSPTFIALRVPIPIPIEPDAAQFFLDKLAERGFDVSKQDFMDTTLVSLYRDAISLPATANIIPDELAKKRYEIARHLIFSASGTVPTLSTRYLDFRSAQNKSFVDWSEFRERVAAQLGYRKSRVYPTTNDVFLDNLIINLFDFEYLKEGGYFTIAREQFDAIGDFEGFWSGATSRATTLLDPNISPDHLFLPRVSDLFQSESGWVTVHFSVPVVSRFAQQLGPLHSREFADAEMDISVAHILRPWLDLRLISRLRLFYPPSAQETNIARISLDTFPERVHVSFLVGRRLRPMFLEEATRPSGALNISSDKEQTAALLRSIAFTGLPRDAVFVFGLLVDGGVQR